MSYKSSLDIDKRLHEHLLYALNIYNKDWFVICLQGSQNYGVADEDSDIDSKLLLIPNLEDLVLNKSAISHTLEMPDNQEHVDCKDIRDYFKIFRKSNINFVEILFTDYWIINHKYYDLWAELRRRAEDLARINPYAAVSCMKGMAHEKRKALTHEYPSRIHMIEKFGYDPKQLSHLIRIHYFIQMYTEGLKYEECIRPKDKEFLRYLLEIKRDGVDSLEEAIKIADYTVEAIDRIANEYRAIHPNKNNEELDNLLNDILYKVITRSLKEQLNE